MPNQIITGTGRVKEGNDVWLAARIKTADGTNLVNADVGVVTIELRVFDKSGAGKGRAPNTAVFTDTGIALTAIKDTLSLTYWDGLDGSGANFEYQLQWDAAGSDGPYMRAGHKYLVQFSLVTTAFGTIHWDWILDVDPGDPS